MTLQRVHALPCCFVACVLVLSGCAHKVRVAAVPPLPVPTISVPPPSHHFEALPAMDLEMPEPLALEIPHMPLPRFRPRPTTSKQLARLLRPAIAPIVLGELTTGDEAASGLQRDETHKLIQDQQQRLRLVTVAVRTAHQQEVDQARLFLRQALDAWHKHDGEGARILATKAKVLLDDTEQ